MGPITMNVHKAGNWLLASPIRLLLVPYAVGIVWHGLHPISSLLTGDMKRPRNVYIDENSLEPSHFSMNGAAYDPIQQTRYNAKKYSILAATRSETIDSLCQGVRTYKRSYYSDSFVDCHNYHSRHHDIAFEVARIQPSSAAIAPSNEAIVLVVPAFVSFPAARIGREVDLSTINMTSKSRWQFQASLLQLIRRLSSHRTAPWLAKSVMVVSPVVNRIDIARNMSSTSQNALSPVLERTVAAFLDAYLGELHLHQIQRSRIAERLPPHLTGAILRNLIVLDLELFEPDKRVAVPTSGTDFVPEMGELRILPQGRRGILPNMDLTVVVRAVYERSSVLLRPQQLDSTVKQRYKLVDMAVHPHHKKVESWFRWIRDRGLPEKLLEWTYKLLHLLAFEHVVAVGPYPPHAPALERGIDALTIQGFFPHATDDDDFDFDKGNTPRSRLSPQQYPLELVQKMEYVIRALSNLHERLHHSTSLYLLPTPGCFIKHEEYLVPALLLIIPLIFRALLIVFQQNPGQGNSCHLDFVGARYAIPICVLWTATVSFLSVHGVPALLNNTRIRLVACSYRWTEKFCFFIYSAYLPLWKEWFGGITKTFHAAVEQWTPEIRNIPIPQVEGFDICCKVLVLYILSLSILVLSLQRVSTLRLGNVGSRLGIQFTSCLLAAFIHVAIAFSHASVAFASAMLWTPLLAFPSQCVRADESKPFAGRQLLALSRFATKLFLLFLSCPFIILDPDILSSHTVYCRYVYLPLHFLFSLLQITESKLKL